MALIDKVYTRTQQAAISHIALRILVLLLIEDECARLVQQATGQPAIIGNYILLGLFSIAFLFSLGKTKFGYIMGGIAGSINVLAKIIILFVGHEQFPNRPYVYIIQCVFVVYFSLSAYYEMINISNNKEQTK